MKNKVKHVLNATFTGRSPSTYGDYTIEQHDYDCHVLCDRFWLSSISVFNSVFVDLNNLNTNTHMWHRNYFISITKLSFHKRIVVLKAHWYSYTSLSSGICTSIWKRNKIKIDFHSTISPMSKHGIAFQ